MNINVIILFGALVLCLLISFLAYRYGKIAEKREALDKIGSAESKARKVLGDAIKNAEAAKVNALLEAKEQILKQKTDLESEKSERRKEVADIENRALKRDELSEKKAEALEQKEENLTKKEEELNLKMTEYNKLTEQRLKELEKISSLTREQAKVELFNDVKEDIKHDIALYIKEQEQLSQDEIDKTSTDLILQTIQRYATETVSFATVSVVQLPNDDMKGRIICREGRNIRTIEQLTDVELIIDDTPEAVIVSSFDPVRREIARLSLENLIIDGRIHPAKIEEIIEKSKRDVENTIKQKGEDAVLKLGIRGINPDLVKLIGRLHYRTSFGQNALVHSIEVAELSGLMAAELGLNVQLARRAGLLHDIGKAIDHEKDAESSHVAIGVDICKKFKERDEIINAVESHHGDVPSRYSIAFIVAAADAISAGRPGARRNTIEAYTQRLTQLEEIVNSYEGVQSSYAVQAGREVRIMVLPDKVSDDDMTIMARSIAKQIEEQMQYPGTIKVNVIRETRATEIAK